jgi:hypothetical protein
MARRLAITGAAMAVVMVVSFSLYVHLLTERAKFMVRTAYELSEQKEMPTVSELRYRYGTRLKRLDGCPAPDCGYTAALSNRVLAFLRIVPYTEMKSYFWVRDGRLIGILLDYTARANGNYAVVSHVQIDFCEGCQSFAIDPWDDLSPLGKDGSVAIGNQAPAAEKRTALSLDTTCLTRTRCYNIADLLPAIWSRTPDNRIACRIQNHEGWVRKPAGWP